MFNMGYGSLLILLSLKIRKDVDGGYTPLFSRFF